MEELVLGVEASEDDYSLKRLEEMDVRLHIKVGNLHEMA